GYIRDTEWLKYTANVTAGVYDLSFRVSSSPGAAGAFHLEDELGNNLTGILDVPATGSYDTYATVTKPGVTLAGGTHVFKMVMHAGYWTLNYWSGQLTSGCTPETDAAFCTRLGKACGSVTAADNCGASRTVASCGTCGTGQTCSANQCVGSGGGADLNPTKDSYVRSGTYAGTNFGTSLDLILKGNNSTSNYARNDWLTFGLGGYTNITSAKLRLYVKSV